jgi:hypothetical protein
MATRAATTVNQPHRLGVLSTLRKDLWWVEPGLIAVFLTIFLGYLTISAFLDEWVFEIGPYLTPVFEPKVASPSEYWWWSPALLILWGPVGFRATCYYYRRAYYRSYFLQPPACAVGDVLPKYSGESRFPLILQNLHRFFMYVALVFVVFLWIGAIRSFYNGEEIIRGEAVETGLGIGLGSVIISINAFLLMMYTFSCHSFRHLVGGGLDCFSCSAWTRARKRVWDRVTSWNENHRLWAWSSLVWIVFCDIYIRLVANGNVNDPNTWGF